jgi:hypothetical protein
VGSDAGTAATAAASQHANKPINNEHATEQEQLFLSWLLKEGASFPAIRLTRNADGLRGIFAAANLEKGDLLMAVPHDIILKLPYSNNDDFCEQGEALMLALLKRDPKHLAHLGVLPTLEESLMSPDT